MARYADQLPINLAPNGANFLLSTNDSDGKALERIPLELAGGGSKKYTILNETVLDVDSNFVLSAGLYLYVGNAPANFDLSALVDGERVEIINHTSHKVYLFGFTNWIWNGTTTSLQTDKGLIIEKGGIIGAKHSDNLLLFNTLPNGLFQSLRAGILPSDPYYNNVVLFLKGDGINNSINIVDSSSMPKAISVFGNAKISTAQSKYTESSIFFDGNGDYLSVEAALELEFGAGDFTVEAWIYPLSTSGRIIMSNVNNGSNISYWTLGLNSTSQLYFGTRLNGNSTQYTAVGGLVTANKWSHVAGVRSGGVLTTFVDGFMGASSVTDNNLMLPIRVPLIGAFLYPGFIQYFDGYFSPARFTNSARYFEDFDPEIEPYLNL